MVMGHGIGVGVTVGVAVGVAVAVAVASVTVTTGLETREASMVSPAQPPAAMANATRTAARRAFHTPKR
jgi:hypothetical protein